MKRALILMLVGIAVIGNGCSTLNRLGITEDHVTHGVRYALQQEGLGDAVTDAQIREIIKIIKAHERLNEIGEEVAAHEAIQNRINEIVNDYIVDGEFVVPTDDDDSEPMSDHPVSKISKWYGGVDMSGATLDTNYQLTVSEDGKNWSAMPDDWHKDKTICAMAYKRTDGTWAGGKYEWLPKPPRQRSYNNIKSGYNGWVAPQAGTPVIVFAYTSDGHRVSTPVHLIFN